jgi:predicted membrane chloride channel (bestrophin family)
MVSDKSSDLAHCFVVFLLTYGFVGLEMVAIELDSTSNVVSITMLTAYVDSLRFNVVYTDPFGNDANDLNIRYAVIRFLTYVVLC